jgi:hypothetical protein
MATTMFRVVRRTDFEPAGVHVWHLGSRLLGDVRYMVDNPGESTRATAPLSRGAAVHGSMRPALALPDASASLDQAGLYVACEERLQALVRTFQLSRIDACCHRDLERRQAMVHKERNQWGEHTLDSESGLAAIFSLQTGPLEIDEEAKRHPELCSLVEKAKGAITMWADTPSLSDRGLNFELDPHSSYTPEPI